MVACPSHYELELFLSGASSKGDRERVRAHVDGCATCRDWIEEARSDEDVLADVRGAAPRLSPLAPGAQAADIERYRIVGQLGAGGMGIVYEAEQKRPRRAVALKVLRPLATGPRALRRFEVEAEVLGRLEHPGIARIFEAGTFESGGGPQPFIAMELVRGRALTEYAAASSASLRERLELVEAIAVAVHHAHQKGVLHRDLKPSNILVTPDGQPKVLDFGLARALDANVRGSLETGSGKLLGTLAYMSPEQVAGDPGELDVRSDVYALGVILYELVADRLPYELGERSLLEVARAIEVDPPAPLGRSVPTDVATIVACALEKEPERRYASAAALADDLRRFLRDEPVAARPPSTVYHLRKFARRNRTLVGALLAVFATLVAGIVATSSQAERARVAETDAKSQALAALAEAARKEDALEFLQDLVSTANPQLGAQGVDYTVREMLDEAARRLDGAGLDAQVEVALRTTLGNAYRSLELFDEAETQLAAALDLVRAPPPDDGEALGTIWNIRSALANDRADYARAEEAARTALTAFRDALGERHESTASALTNLAAAVHGRGRLEEAGELFQAALTLQREVHGEEHTEVALTLMHIGSLHQSSGEHEQAEALLRRALDMHERTSGKTHLTTAACRCRLAGVVAELGRLKDAEELYRDALAALEHLYGADHDALGRGLAGLAEVVAVQGRRDEAVELYRDALARLDPTLETDARTRLRALSYYGSLQCRQGDFAAAETCLREALALSGRFFAAADPRADGMRDTLYRVLSCRGDYSALRELYEEASEALRHSTVDEPLRALRIELRLGAALVLEGSGERAARVLEGVLARAPEVAGPRSALVGQALTQLALALLATGASEDAELLLRDAVDVLREAEGERGPNLAAARVGLARTLLELQRPADALPLCQPALDALRGRFFEEHERIGELLTVEGRALAALGRSAEARERLARAEAHLQQRLGPEHPWTHEAVTALAAARQPERPR